MRAIEGSRCPHCGGPLTYESVPQAAGGGREAAVPPSAGEIALCVRCVSMVLCMAMVAIHGDVGDRPQSHHFPGHDDRMRDHQERLRRMGLVNDVDESEEELAEAMA